MLGTIVNTAAIIVGSAAGSLLKKGIKEKYQHALFNALGVATIVLGANASITHMSKSTYPVLFILSLAMGGLIGTILDLDGRVNRVVSKRGGSKLAQGLTTGVLLYCIGTLSIVGPVISALQGDNTYLYTNATLDFVSSTVLSATYGFGMLFAAPILFCWQGSIYLIARYLSASFFSNALIDEISIVGGVLIVSSGLSILNIKDCKTLNLLPSLLIPIFFFIIKSFF